MRSCKKLTLYIGSQMEKIYIFDIIFIRYNNECTKIIIVIIKIRKKRKKHFKRIFEVKLLFEGLKFI